MSNDDPSAQWPFEAIVDQENGSHEYHQFARDNGNGTVTVHELHLPGGYSDRIYSKALVRLRERPSDKARRWYELFKRVYGTRRGDRS